MTAFLPQPEANRDIFIVRRWRNPADGSWRGQVIHVQSGQSFAFTSDEALVAHIQNHLHDQTDKRRRRGIR